MSTLAEIQDAVTKLQDGDKKALALWLNSQTEPELNPQEELHLLRSLDNAMSDLEAGKGVPIEALRQKVAAWAAK